MSAARDDADGRRSAVIATLCAGVMIAFQTASKVIRDTMFFETFEVTRLPMMVVGTAIASIAFAIPAGRLLRVLSPARLIPGGFALSAVLLVVEWLFAHEAPQMAAIAVYLHFGALGAVLISGFWSLINERFDPHSAKLYVSRIAGGATLGGLAGGIIAERLSNVLEAAAGLPVLAAFHVICAVLTWVITAHHRPPRGATTESATGNGDGETAVAAAAQPGDEERDGLANESMLTGLAIVGRVPYLRNLAILVLVTTTASGLLDYLFKAATVAHFPEKAELQRFFAIFYTASALATFLVQAIFGKRVLYRFGIAVTMGSLPVIAGLGAVLNLVFPGIWSSTLLRGGEMSLRSSLFRAGYEQHYAPIPRSEKRPAKSVIDVVVDRAGDAVGGGIIQLFLVIAHAMGAPLLTLLGSATVALYVIAISITRRLRGGYIQAVEKSLIERAIDLEAIDPHTRAKMHGMSSPYDSLKNASIGAVPQNMQTTSLQSLAPVPPGVAPQAKLGSAHNATADHLVAICVDLRSRDKARVKRALKAFSSIDRPPVQLAIPLLAWDEVAALVVATLRQSVDRHCGTLLDALFDETEELTIRRRVPRVLAAATTQRAVDGLLTALANKRFEIRYRAAIALVLIRNRAPNIVVDASVVFNAIRAAVASDARMTASRTIVDRMPDDDASLLGEVLEERLDRGLELVFALLSLVLDPQHVRIAFQGIHTNDPALHGLALEYLDSVLPDDLRADVLRLVSIDEKTKHRAGGVSRDQRQVVEDLLRSRESIVMNLTALKKDAERAAKESNSDSKH